MEEYVDTNVKNTGFKIESDVINKHKKIKKEKKQLKKEVKRLNKIIESLLADFDDDDEEKLYNGISNMYGWSVGIYDFKGNKLCNGYNLNLPDKRIEDF